MLNTYTPHDPSDRVPSHRPARASCRHYAGILSLR